MGKPRQRRPTFSGGSNHMRDSSAWDSDSDESFMSSSHNLLPRATGTRQRKRNGERRRRPSQATFEHPPYTDDDADFSGIPISPTYSVDSSNGSLKSNPSTRRSSVSSGIDDVCMPLDEDASETGEENYTWPDLKVLEDFCKKQREEDVALQESEAYRESHNEATEAEQRGRLRPKWHVPWTRDSALDTQNHMRFTYFRDDLYATIHSPSISGLLGPGQTFNDLFPTVHHDNGAKAPTPAFYEEEHVSHEPQPAHKTDSGNAARAGETGAGAGTSGNKPAHSPSGSQSHQATQQQQQDPQVSSEMPHSMSNPALNEPSGSVHIPTPPPNPAPIPDPEASVNSGTGAQQLVEQVTTGNQQTVNVPVSPCNPFVSSSAPKDQAVPPPAAAQPEPNHNPASKHSASTSTASNAGSENAELVRVRSHAPSISSHSHVPAQSSQVSQHGTNSIHRVQSHSGRGMYPAITIDPASASKIHSHSMPLHSEERGPWWLDINCPSEDEMRVLSRAFGVHPLTTEDILLHETREKIELFHNYYFVCFTSFDVRFSDSKNESERRARRDSSGQISQSSKASKNMGRQVERLRPLVVFSIVFHTGIITVHYRPTPHTVNVRRRIRLLRDYLNVTSDWISYALIDDITDGYGPLIESVDEDVQEIEDAILGMHGHSDDDDSVYDEKRSLSSSSGSSSTGYREWRRKGNMLRWIGESRKRVMSLLSLIGNKADVIKGFSKRLTERWNGAPTSEIAMYLSDIQDHVVTMTQSLNHYEKLLARSHSNYLAQINIDMTRTNNEMNDVLSKISVLGTIVLPINIVTGLWGMNVIVPGQFVENLNWFYGIILTLLLFAVSAYFLLMRLM